MRCITGRDHREFILRRIKAGSRVLEWGSGGSTLWLAEHLPDGAKLTSIEHHEGWYQTVVRKIGNRKNVRMICCPPEAEIGENATIAEEDPTHLSKYIHAVDGEQFDVIIVDGVARNSCMIHAKQLLSTDGGTIFIHDAQRHWYDDAKSHFIEHGTIGSCEDYAGPMLWFGGIDTQRNTMSEASAPLIISYFTLDTPYEEEVKRLRASCEKLGIDHVIEGRASAGSWERNCAMKARFVKECSDRFTRPVLWVDADATLASAPNLLGGAEMDFAVSKARGWQFNSATAYFNRTENGQRVLDAWVEECERAPDVWDQIHLDTAWERVAARHPLRTMWLPPSYAKIFDLDLASKYGDLEPVIEQFQASRRFKQEVSVKHEPVEMRDPDEELIQARLAGRPRRCWYDERYVLQCSDPEIASWASAPVQ
ncbi:MAG: class I SAM-dependent methyltransferase [Phycisphaerales bacterium]|nr:class I SAM-dependent methyltransferase [Phycisphaerales bacterium]